MRTYSDIMFRDSTRPVGMLLALNAIGYAVQLARGGDSVLSGSPWLSALRDLAPSWVWAFTFGAAGVIEIAALALDRRRVRAWAAALYALVWAFIAGSAWAAAPYTFAPVSWTTFAAASAWLTLRLIRPERVT